tara:strand:- start:391 stop:1305 length:915 start_codon:yes stop_codon:yes gene_type:complete
LKNQRQELQTSGIYLFISGKRGIGVVCSLVELGYKIEKIFVPNDGTMDENKRFSKVFNNENIINICKDKLKNLNTFIDTKPLLFIVAGFPYIFPDKIINLPQYGTINLHSGRLPQYRGGSPMNWQMINGEKYAGISIIQMNSSIDTGDILESRLIEIKEDYDIKDLHDIADKIYPEMVINVLKKIQKNSVNKIKQNSLKASYWHQRKDSDGKIDFNKMSCVEVERFVKALTKPYPGAWGKYKGKKLRIFKVEKIDINVKGSAGRICWIQGLGPIVVCSNRAIKLTEFRYDDGSIPRLMSGDFLE